MKTLESYCSNQGCSVETTAQGPCMVTGLSLQCPLAVVPGFPFIVYAIVHNYALAEQPIYTLVRAVGTKSGKVWTLIDLYQYFPAESVVTYNSDVFYMPNEPVKIEGWNYIWYPPSPGEKPTWVWECYKTVTIDVLPEYEKVYAWLTIAEGNNFDDLKAKYPETEIPRGYFRMVIKTTAPTSLIKPAKWFIDSMLLPLKAIGVDLVNVEVKGSDIYIYMHASPVAVPTVVYVIAAIAAVVVLARYISKVVIQWGMVYDDYIKYKIAQTKEELIKYLVDILTQRYPNASPDEIARAVQSIVAGWPSNEPEKAEERWYEKYIKYALIGGGVILGIAVLTPVIVKAISGAKA